MVKRLIKHTKTEGERRKERDMFPKGVRFRTAIPESPCHLWGTNPGRWNQGRKCKVGDERVAGREQSEQDEYQPMLAMLRFAGQIAHVVVESVDVE